MKRKSLRDTLATIAICVVVLLVSVLQKPSKATVSSGADPEIENSGESPILDSVSATMPRVSNVVDGDTLEVTLGSVVKKIRLIGVNTPETVDPRKSVECFGKEASHALKMLLPVGTVVDIVVDETQGTLDKYGRTLAYIQKDSRDIGGELIRDGYAYEYTYQKSNPYKNQAQYKSYQAQAQEKQRGLWSPNTCNGKK